MDRQIKRPLRVHPFLYIYRHQKRSNWFCLVPYINPDGARSYRRKGFRDRRYGTKVAALAFAQQWRDEQIELAEVREAMGDQRPLRLFTTVSEATPFGLVGVKPIFRDKPFGGNMSATAQTGRRRWFSMRKYGVWGAYELAVARRCSWIGAELPARVDLEARFNRWFEGSKERLSMYGLGSRL